jgi:hypothetical protein
VRPRVGFRDLVSRGAGVFSDVVLGEPDRGDVHYSEEHRGFLKSAGRCRSCGKRDPHGARFLRADGTETSFTQRAGVLPNDSVAECRSCGTRWPVYGGPAQAIAVEIIETERSIELDHTDPLELDNLGGTSPLMYTQTITEEWTQTIQVDTEKSEVKSATSDLEMPGLGTFGKKTEEALKSKFSITEQARKVLTREFPFEVPPATKRHVDFNYQRVWQNGLARITSSDGTTVEMPFRVAVDMTVNLAQRDTTA